MEDKSRRIARLGVTFTFLLEVLKGEGEARTFTVDNALPDDAEISHFYIEALHLMEAEQQIWLVLRSESFAPVKQGELIPILPPPICKVVRKAASV